MKSYFQGRISWHWARILFDIVRWEIVSDLYDKCFIVQHSIYQIKEISGIYDNIGVTMEFVINPDWGYTMVRIDRSSLDRVVKEQIEFCRENM